MGRTRTLNYIATAESLIIKQAFSASGLTVKEVSEATGLHVCFLYKALQQGKMGVQHRREKLFAFFNIKITYSLPVFLYNAVVENMPQDEENDINIVLSQDDCTISVAPALNRQS